MPKGIFPRTLEHNRNIALANKGKNNGMWRGNKVGNNALRDWVKYWLKKPKNCDSCKKEKRLDLANISQEYKRDIKDWEWLCRSCHMKKDGRLERLHKGNIGRKHNKIKTIELI